MCSSPQLCQQPTGSVNLGKISILQLTLQPFDGYVLPTFISRRVCKLINIFFFSHSLSLPFRQIFVSSEVSVGKPSSQLHMLPAANQVGWNPETNRNLPPPPSSLLCLSSCSPSAEMKGVVGCVSVCVGGCLRKIKTYSGEEERGWLRHKPKAMSPLFCLSTQSSSCLRLS